MLPYVNEPQPIHFYLPHGDLAGLAVASTLANPVKVFRVPRSMLHEYELGVWPKDNGVFFLVGGDGDGSPHCYIASGHDLPARIIARDVETSRWQTAYYAVSGASPWTQTEAGYIGSHCAEKAAGFGRYAPYGPATAFQSSPAPELDKQCEGPAFAISLLLAILGCDALGQVNSVAADERLFYLNRRQSSARSRVSSDGSVTVLAGSFGLAEATNSLAGSIVRYRERLIEQGVAYIQGNRFELLADHRFESLSTSAAVITGKSINGQEAWKSAEGETPRQIGEKAA